MPNNDEIDAALKLYRELYRHEHSGQLRNLRRIALDIMRELAAFNPYLTGSVLRGSAGKYADIHLQLFSDNGKSIEHYLLSRNIRFRSRETRLYAGDMPLVVPVLTFDRDGYEVHLTLLSSRDQRAQLKTSIEGKPIERAKPEVVASLIAEN
jgi:predicted nucleotidyltransferase